MKAKKLVCVLVVLMMLVASAGLLAEGQKDSAQEGAGGDSVYNFRFAHSQPNTSPRHKSMEFFKKELEARSDGRITVELFPNGVLGTEAAVMDMVKANSVQGTRGSQFVKANPKYNIYNMPFLFNSTDEFEAVLASDFEKKLADGAKANGFYIPATGIAGGYRQITNNVRPIESPADIKGLVMRTPPLDPQIRAMKALGANPQQIPYKETYMALKTGVVDGQENPASNIVEMKFYEVQKYLSVVDYMLNADCLFVSHSWYQSLPSDLQQIFDEVSVETMQYSNDVWLSSESDYLETLKEKCEVNFVNNDNRMKFREMVAPSWGFFIERNDFTRQDKQELEEFLAGIR
jgi:tripartite ATP-independent transporter DctP family solute receptor